MDAAEIDVEVGKRLREQRDALGMSQTRLADRLGVSFSQVQRYENGTNRIGAGRLYQAAYVLNVPIAYFYGALDRDQTETTPSAGPTSDGDFASLSAAFLSIPDADTRASVVALARSLAGRPYALQTPALVGSFHSSQWMGRADSDAEDV